MHRHHTCIHHKHDAELPNYQAVSIPQSLKEIGTQAPAPVESVESILPTPRSLHPHPRPYPHANHPLSPPLTTPTVAPRGARHAASGGRCGLSPSENPPPSPHPNSPLLSLNPSPRLCANLGSAAITSPPTFAHRSANVSVPCGGPGDGPSGPGHSLSQVRLGPPGGCGRGAAGVPGPGACTHSPGAALPQPASACTAAWPSRSR